MTATLSDRGLRGSSRSVDVSGGTSRPRRSAMPAGPGARSSPAAAPATPRLARWSCCPGVVRAPTSGPASTWRDPQGLADARVLGELLGRDPPVDRQVERGRLQVLAHRQDVAAGLDEVAHRGGDLVRSLAHPQDQVRLRDLARAEALRDPQHLERAVVAERGTDPVVQAPAPSRGCGRTRRARPSITVAMSRLPALEVARQHLDAAAGDRRADRRGSPAAQIAAPPSGRSSRATPVSDDVPQAHRAHGVGDPRGLGLVHGLGLGGHHVAEPAPARALRAEDQERRLALLPAFVRCWGTSPPRTRCGGRGRA